MRVGLGLGDREGGGCWRGGEGDERKLRHRRLERK